jgi:hypothetical protein
MNSSELYIYGTIKLHKHEKSIRPIVNWIDSPGCKIAKYLNKLLNNFSQLPNAFNTRNTNKLAHSLKLIYVNKGIRLCSFDIENMYTNIPIREVKNITGNIIDKDNNISQKMKEEILNLLNIILEQNYIQHSGR